mmetsp:Transcript_11369/g.19165  ORF Transcript_11369/g.19165 Transcript_11369/m.19165 type:complete len:197 (+) Transcript_11369:784-1374(+)
MAQQMEIEDDRGANHFTFRKWNPDKERVMWGSETAYQFEPVCPMVLISCYLTEILCFKLRFNDTIDHICQVYKEPTQILDEYRVSTNILAKTNVLRLVAWILNLIGCYLIFSPFTLELVWIPFIGSLLKATFFMTGLIFSTCFSILLQMVVVSVSWIPYRPYLGLLGLILSLCTLGFLFIGEPLSEEEGESYYFDS